MPRTLRPLDPSAGPVQAFAAELRKLYEEAGSPKFQQMAFKDGQVSHLYVRGCRRLSSVDLGDGGGLRYSLRR
jgi:hypothetical protein